MSNSHDAVSGGVVAVLGTIYNKGIEHCLPWVIAMLAIILCDLITGLRCAWLTGEKLRWSKGFRATMSKMVSYLAFVFAFVMVGVASGYDDIPKYACLTVIAVEGISIIGNILSSRIRYQR